ncbi:MAG: hypothetical protein M1158_04315 [Candidatus Marsarchaeota archaeon]|jgi:sulfite exporter TauE/SafE|nr:hypothetical protein [Candidatus Marsarchaeota archaeon]
MPIALNLNFWNPTNVTILEAIILSYVLGIIHGITPDEHTWPITFSYAIGSYSVKGGAKAGLLFSTGFTVQRAILSEIAFFALAAIFMSNFAFGVTYIIVGIAMAGAGFYIAGRGRYPHWHYIEERLGEALGIHKHGSKEQHLELEHKVNPALCCDDSISTKPVPSKLALVHGFIAGFGFGAFALIIYTVLSPAMHSAWLGWLPGALFGLGTMTMQIAFGAFFGGYMRKIKKLTEKGLRFVSVYMSTFVLKYGGIVFIVGGALILTFPQILGFAIATGIKVHNLDSLGIGFFLVIISVIVLGYAGYVLAMRSAKQLGYMGTAAAKQQQGV